jgi:hypothetical protein
MLKALLNPVGIEVRMEVQVVGAPPRADILLIRQETSEWTQKQRLLLADGLRDLVADHIHIELKIMESLTEYTLKKSLVYDHLILTGDDTLTREQLQSVIICARTPQDDILKQFDFKPTGVPGVYECEGSRWCDHLRVILLNELSNEPHNAPLKCFASRQSERRKAFKTIQQSGIFKISSSFGQIIAGLWRLRMREALDNPEMEGVTPEHVIQLGKEWFEFMVETTPDEELFSLPKLEHYLTKIRHTERQEGRQEGALQGAAQTLLRQLSRKFGDTLPDWVPMQLQTADQRLLEIWTDRILDADALEKVFQNTQNT